MKPEEKKILIGLSTNEYIRRAEFIPFFIGLKRPVGSISTTVHGQSPATARNMIVKQGLENGATHILFIDDDMIYDADSLEKLMKHDVDIVSGLYLVRSFPHRPAFFDKAYDNGRCKYAFMDNKFGLNGSSLVEGVNCGLGFVLVSIEVFKKLEEPWVRLGEIEKDGWCDDVGFFNRCRKAGFKIYVDTDVCIGHMSTMTIFPIKVNGEWRIEYRQQDGNVQFPPQVPTEQQLKDEELKRGVSLPV